jgi:hypothetical protein
MEVSGQFHAPAALPLGKILWYSLVRWLGGTQSRSESGGEKKKPNSRRESNPGRPARSLVTVLTELSRLPRNNIVVISSVIFHSVVCDGVSICFRTESITKFTLTKINAH